MAFEGIKEIFTPEVEKRANRIIDSVNETSKKEITGGNLEEMEKKWNRMSLDLIYLENNNGKNLFKTIQEKAGISDIAQYIADLGKKVNIGNEIKNLDKTLHGEVNGKFNPVQYEINGEFEKKYPNELTQMILDELKEELRIKVEGYKKVTRNDLNSLKTEYEANKIDSIT